MLKRVEKLKIEYAHRKKFSQMEIKYRLLKSLIDTHNLSSLHKIVYQKKLRPKMQAFGVSRQRGACFLTGRAKGVIRFLGFSRHTLKRQALLNKVQNIRVGS
jgi:ribosomal protein S14